MHLGSLLFQEYRDLQCIDTPCGSTLSHVILLLSLKILVTN